MSFSTLFFAGSFASRERVASLLRGAKDKKRPPPRGGNAGAGDCLAWLHNCISAAMRFLALRYFASMPCAKRLRLAALKMRLPVMRPMILVCHMR